MPQRPKGSKESQRFTTIYTSHGINLTILLFSKGVFILKNPIGLKSYSTGRQFRVRIYLFVYVEVKEAGMG